MPQYLTDTPPPKPDAPAPALGLVLISGSVGPSELADGAVQARHLASGVVPVAAAVKPMAGGGPAAAKVNEVILALKAAGLMKSG